VIVWTEIDQYGFFVADTDILAIHRPVPIFPKFFILISAWLSTILCIVCLTFSSKTSKIRIYELKFSNSSNFNILLWFLINLINDGAVVLAATTDTCSMVYLVCLFIKPYLLALLQDNCLDFRCCAFLSKLSGCVRNITAFCQHLLRPIKSAILADTDISAKPKYRMITSAKPIYWPISTSEHKLLNRKLF